MVAAASPAAAAETYPIRTDTGAAVNVRSGPGTDYDVVGSVDSGDYVTIECTGYDNAGQLWNRTPTGCVIDEYTITGTSSATEPSCSSSRQWDKEQAEIDRNNGGSSSAGCVPGAASYHDVRAVLFGTCWPSPMIEDRLSVKKLTLLDGTSVVGRIKNPLRACSSPLPNGDYDGLFTVPCQMHDYGYQLIREGALSRDAKTAADNLFHEAMRQTCEAHGEYVDGCYLAAAQYWHAVRKFGWLVL